MVQEAQLSGISSLSCNVSPCSAVHAQHSEFRLMAISMAEVSLLFVCFTRHLVCLFYWANGRRTNRTRGPMRGAPPYPIQTRKTRPQHRELHALLFTTSVRVLLRPTGLWTLKGCETGPPAYRPYPRRLESLTICRCNYKRAALSPQLFKDPECWSGRSWTHDLPRDSPVLNQLSHRCTVSFPYSSV